MEGPIDMERKGCESIGCYTHFVTFNVPLTHDLDLGFRRSNFEKVISGMGWPIDMELKGCESIECWTHAVTFNGHLTHDLYLGFSRSNFESRISEMGWPIDMERKGCESIGCYIYFVTFNVHLTHDLDLGSSRSNFENAVSQEWNGRLTWNKSDVNRLDVTPTLWLSTFPSPMTLTSDFRGQILKKSYLRNGMADLHGIKGMWVDRMLDPCCDF